MVFGLELLVCQVRPELKWQRRIWCYWSVWSVSGDRETIGEAEQNGVSGDDGKNGAV